MFVKFNLKTTDETRSSEASWLYYRVKKWGYAIKILTILAGGENIVAIFVS